MTLNAIFTFARQVPRLLLDAVMPTRFCKPIASGQNRNLYLTVLRLLLQGEEPPGEEVGRIQGDQRITQRNRLGRNGGALWRRADDAASLHLGAPYWAGVMSFTALDAEGGLDPLLAMGDG